MLRYYGCVIIIMLYLCRPTHSCGRESKGCVHSLLGRPQLLNFPPYDKDQLVTILEKKLPSLLSSDVTFDPSAMQFCARKVSSVHGDLRKAVDICRRSVEVLEAKKKQAKCE